MFKKKFLGGYQSSGIQQVFFKSNCCTNSQYTSSSFRIFKDRAEGFSLFKISSKMYSRVGYIYFN